MKVSKYLSWPVMLLESAFPALVVYGWYIYPHNFILPKPFDCAPGNFMCEIFELVIFASMYIIPATLAALVVNSVLPQATNRSRSIFFAIPAGVTYFAIYGIYTFFLIESNDIESFAFQIINIIFYWLPISLVLIICTAIGGYLGTRINVKLYNSLRASRK